MTDDDDDQEGRQQVRKQRLFPTLTYLHHSQKTQEEAVPMEEPLTQIICPYLRLHPQQVLEVIENVLDAPKGRSVGATMF